MAITSAKQTEILKIVAGLFNAAPGGTYLTELANLVQGGMTTSQLADALAAHSLFTGTIMAGKVTTDSQVAVLMSNFGFTADSDPASAGSQAKAYLMQQVDAGVGFGKIVFDAVTYLSGSPATEFATAATLLSNKALVAAAYSLTTSSTSLSTLQNVLSNVTGLAAYTDAQVNEILTGSGSSSTAGLTFTLTTGADILNPTSLTSTLKTTNGNDTIYANADAAFSASDIIDAGGGADSLFSVQDTANVATTETLTPLLTSVEKVYVDVNDGGAGSAATYAFNGSTSTGLQEVWSNAFSGSTTGTEDTFVINNIATSVVTGIKKGDGEYHVTTTYNSVTGATDSATLAVEEASVDTVTIAGIETLNVRVDGAASTESTNASTIATLTTAQLGTLKVTGARNLTVTNNIDFQDASDSLAFDGTVDASGMSGNLTLTLGTGGDNVKFTGGTGKNTVTTAAGNDNLTGGDADDSFTIGAGNDTVSGGGGNDRVVMTVANLGSSDSIKLGDGARDALILDTTTVNVTGVNATNLDLINKMTGIEVIGSSGAVTAIDASYFNQTIFEATANLTAAVTMSNVAGDTLILSGNGITGVAGDALTVSGSLPNQSLTLELKGANAVTLQGTDGGAGNTGLTISSGISTVNIVSSTTNTSPTTITNLIQNVAATTATHTIDNASAGSFVLTGSVNLTIASGLTAGFTKAVDFNATAFTGKLSIVGSDQADVIKGGTGVDTINGHDGDDVLTGGGGADTFVFVSAHGSTAPSTSVFETITDYTKSVDIIDWDASLTIDEASATAVATTAKVSSTGIATFHGDDDTFAEKIVAAAKGMDADGDFVVFEHSGDTYVYISGDANATQDAADALVKLTGVVGITAATVDGNNNIVLS